MARRTEAPEALAPAEVHRERVYLHAGQIFATSEPCEVSTVLGSCVGVVLIDGARRVGGASHYLLPYDGGGSPRYGNGAITTLVARTIALGSRKPDLVAKVFGGSSILSQVRPERPSLGAQNVEVARRRLAEEGIAIVAEDVGGFVGRKVVFLTDCGQVWVKRL
ncbi:MAG TPA: chemotaxis protein CheD [Polyangiaceae bacterium]|nr:chemotaxis protein CheD [Polyangiaceae bacterium]